MNKKRERAQCIKICKVSSTSSTDAQAQVYVHIEQKRNAWNCQHLHSQAHTHHAYHTALAGVSTAV
jgi:hypothetical protein